MTVKNRTMDCCIEKEEKIGRDRDFNAAKNLAIDKIDEIITSQIEFEVMIQHEKGLNIEEISDELHISENEVKSALKANGIASGNDGQETPEPLAEGV
jgi:DNA-binding NarL/FixJ family response regulator